MEDISREEAEHALKVLDKCLPHLRWRLRPKAKRRLVLDIMALCTELRPAVMIDYGGKMPELQEQLCGLLHMTHKESRMFHSLRVMIIEEMVYLVHILSILEHMRMNIRTDLPIQFVVLDQGPVKLALPDRENALIGEFVSIQGLLLSVMSNHVQDMITMPSKNSSFLNISDKATSDIFSTKIDVEKESKLSSRNPSLECNSRSSSEVLDLIDLSECMMGTQIAPPTLNGWLLGYPIVYLFSREHVAEAVGSLAIGSLHLFRILICSKVSFGKEHPEEEELMSFSVPANLSILGKDEPWAETFFLRMLEKVDRCKEVWRYIKLEVTSCNPSSIAL